MKRNARKENNGNKAPVVSVVMPAYRAAEYIGAALDSVFAQTFTDFEVIVVNDGSPDTAEMERAIEPYRERIIYLEQENRGPSAARNAALTRARGHYIAFLDADDYWEPTYLAEQLQFIEKNPMLDLVYSDALLVGESPLAGRSFMEIIPSQGEVTFGSLLGGTCTVILSATVVRRQAVVEAGLFDESLSHAEDYDLWLRMAKAGARLDYQNRVLLGKRMQPLGLGSDRVRLHERALRVIEKNTRDRDLTETERAARDGQVAKLTAILNLEKAKFLLLSRDFAGAQEAIEKANSFYNNWKLRLTLVSLRVSPRLLLRAYKMISPPGPDSCQASRAYAGGESLTIRAGLYMFAKTVAFILSIAIPLLLVRRLSQHEFGLYKQVFLIVGTSLSMLPLGVGMSAYYFLPRESERQGQIIFNILLFYLLTAGAAFAAFALHPPIVSTIFNSPDLAGLSALIGVVIFLWVFSSFLEIVSVAHQEFRLATVFVIASQFTKAVLLLAAALLFASVRGLIYAAIIQGALQTVIMLVYLRSRFGPFWRSFELSVMRRQLAYALPLGVAAVIIGFQSDIHNYFVANQFDAAMFAIYSIGCFHLPVVSIISESVGSVMIPRVSYLQKFGRRREIIELTAKMGRKLSAVYFPLYVFLLVLGHEFIILLFTPQYAASYPIFAINLTLIPLAILTSLSDPVIRAYAEHRYFLLRARVTLLVLLVAALWYATPRFGMIGAIAITICVNAIERFVSLAKAGQALQVRRSDIDHLKDIGKLAIAAAASGAVLAVVRPLLAGFSPIVVLALGGIVFFAVYLVGVLSFGILTDEERETIKRQAARLRRPSRKRADLLRPAHQLQTAAQLSLSPHTAVETSQAQTITSHTVAGGSK